MTTTTAPATPEASRAVTAQTPAWTPTRTPTRSPLRRVRARLARLRVAPAAGMTTAEYAVGTVAACAFGGLLYKVVTSGEVMSLVTDVIRRGLSLSM